ncbi:MAG: hypothetical protein JNL32_16645, partial [Candidatus Kapabacteria bacterium]|nr:hypothetical protein [Candidatus Kapabacteria bacterium]
LPNADGTSGQVLRTDGAGNLSWATTGLQYFTEARNNTALNATVPVHQFAASGAETNIDIAITPKGTGALTAHIADGTAAGGDKRGNNSVDWQTSRSAANQVASGSSSVVSGGTRNIASGSQSTVGGGFGNVASNLQSTVGGGISNTASGGTSTIAGGSGNTASVTYATIGGGNSNTASGVFATIPGGNGLTLSGSSSFGFLANTSFTNNMIVSASNTTVLGNTDLWLASNDNTPRSLRFYGQYNTAGAFPNGTNFVGFKAPNTIATSVTWTLPNADGTSGQVLRTDGAGNLSWATT